jgi:ankyrin repeat protein
MIFEGLSQNAPETVHTSLIDAAMDGDIFSITMSLKDGKDPNKEDSRERTPLHWAAKNGHEKVVEMLLHHNPNVDKKDLEGSTALYLAAEYGHVRVVEILQQHNADVDKTDRTKILDYGMGVLFSWDCACTNGGNRKGERCSVCGSTEDQSNERKS